jgi:transcriptional regulator with XRE-family HTH domain
MSIKQQIVSEIELRKLLRVEKKDKLTYRKIAKEIGMTPNGLSRWVTDKKGRGIGSDKLEKIAEILGKKFILVDKDI